MEGDRAEWDGFSENSGFDCPHAPVDKHACAFVFTSVDTNVTPRTQSVLRVYNNNTATVEREGK